jgi:hypothetical protein
LTQRLELMTARYRGGVALSRKRIAWHPATVRWLYAKTQPPVALGHRRLLPSKVWVSDGAVQNGIR